MRSLASVAALHQTSLPRIGLALAVAMLLACGGSAEGAGEEPDDDDWDSWAAEQDAGGRSVDERGDAGVIHTPDAAQIGNHRDPVDAGADTDVDADQDPAVEDDAEVGPGVTTAPATTSPPATSVGLAGTWKGPLSRSDGKVIDMTFTFSAAGNMIFQYSSSGSVKNVELTAAGQRLPMYVSNGGVTEIQVTSLVKTSDSFSVTYQGSWEDSDANAVYHEQFSFTYEFKLQAGGLSAKQTHQSRNMINGANTSSVDTVATGVLHKT